MILDANSAYSVVADFTVGFGEAGITANNTRAIYKVYETILSYVPGRSINQINSFEFGVGYYIITGALPLDLTGIVRNGTKVDINLSTAPNVIYTTTAIDTPTANVVYNAMEAGTYSNLKLADGTTAPAIIVTAEEVAPDGVYDRTELRYNAQSNTWVKVAIAKRASATATPVTLSNTIKFDLDYYIVSDTLEADTMFTANTANAIKGGGTLMYLRGNGTAVPTFSSELVRVGSTTFNNTANFLNQILFFYTGGIYTYTITQIGVVASLDGKVAQYNFEQTGNFTDNVQGNSLIQHNTTQVAGKHGSGVQFNGAGAYLEGTGGMYNFTGSFTFAFWIKPNSLANNQSVFHHYLTESIACYISGADASLAFTVLPTSGSAGAADEVRSTGSLVVGTWTHYAITYDGTTLSMYTNGALTVSKPHAPAKATTYGFLVGGVGLFSDLNAVLDDLYVYNRAITQSEISAIYAA